MAEALANSNNKEALDEIQFQSLTISEGDQSLGQVRMLEALNVWKSFYSDQNA